METLKIQMTHEQLYQGFQYLLVNARFITSIIDIIKNTMRLSEITGHPNLPDLNLLYISFQRT